MEMLIQAPSGYGTNMQPLCLRYMDRSQESVLYMGVIGLVNLLDLFIQPYSVQNLHNDIFCALSLCNNFEERQEC